VPSGIRSLTARRLVVILDGRGDRRRIEAVACGKRGRRFGLFHAAIIYQLDEFLFSGAHVENLLIKDRKARPVLCQNVRCKARIAGAFVAEAVAGVVDDDPALLDRGPRQQAAVRIGNRGVALIGADIAQRGTEFVPPQHCFAGAAARAKILRSTNLRAEARH